MNYDKLVNFNFSKYKKTRQSSSFYRKIKKKRLNFEKQVNNKITNPSKHKNLVECDKTFDTSVYINDKQFVNEIELHPAFDVDKSCNSNNTIPNLVIDKSKSSDFRSDLKHWGIDFQIKHNALNSLLVLLRKHFGNSLSQLPQDARCLLSTPRKIEITSMENSGYFWYYGFQHYIFEIFKDTKNNLLLELNINIDGLPIYNSSKKQFWPILVQIHDMPQIRPLVVGIYYGEAKPRNIDEFLTPLVNELLYIIQNNVHINGKIIKIRVRCFIADSPARSFIKGKY